MPNRVEETANCLFLKPILRLPLPIAEKKEYLTELLASVFRIHTIIVGYVQSKVNRRLSGIKKCVYATPVPYLTKRRKL